MVASVFIAFLTFQPAQPSDDVRPSIKKIIDAESAMQAAQDNQRAAAEETLAKDRKLLERMTKNAKIIAGLKKVTIPETRGGVAPEGLA